MGLGFMKTSVLARLIIVIVLLQPFVAFAAGLTLVENGQPRAVIIVPDADVPAGGGASRRQARAHSVTTAAMELADYCRKATCAALPIQGQSAAIDAAKLPVRIYLGHCTENRKQIADKPLRPEEFVVRTTPGALHIVGGDTTQAGGECAGTLNATYAFLEDYLHVRWLFPGDLGEVVPAAHTLAIPELNLREQPQVAQRKFRNDAIAREETFAPVLQQWGIAIEDWKQACSPEVTGPWFRRQRIGGRIHIEAGHSFGGFYEKYGAAHPDFFALQPDGTRKQVPVRERLCVSNPALWDFVARLRIDELKANPHKTTASIMPNDGGPNKFCMCPQCRAWDPPSAPQVSDPKLVDPSTKQPFPSYPALSDRYFRFFNEVANRVRAELPDRYVATCAYSVYRTVPVELKQLDPNLVVGYVGLDLDAIEAWSKVAPRLFIRPNDLNGTRDVAMPRNFAPQLAHAIKFSVDHHAIGFDIANCRGNWAANGLDYYVAAKALWNPGLDVRAVIADYCSAAYGPGAPAMQLFFDRLEKITDSVRSDPQTTAKANPAARLPLYYTPAALDELDALLSSARQAIGSSDSRALARLAMNEDAMKYARLVMALLYANKQPRAKNSPVVRERLAAVDEFLKARTLTLSFASLHDQRWVRMALSNSQREDE
jgi:hypothetical protein